MARTDLMRGGSALEHDPDDALLEFLTGPVKPNLKTASLPRRDAILDPLLLAAAAASGPHVTRNHYHHDFFPGASVQQLKVAQAAQEGTRQDRERLTYVSRQAPRRVRLQVVGAKAEKENDHRKESVGEPLKSTGNVPLSGRRQRASTVASAVSDSNALTFSISPAIPATPPALAVKCMARTRIPTPHGPAFLHLYHNNRDAKEHLAIVIDSAQYSDDPASALAPPIRSRSLDAVWSENETEADRITRGAYTGRLSSSSRVPSAPYPPSQPLSLDNIPPPLIRIHSECFTGETIGSMRCDCGEQLDEAIRLISQPITIPASTAMASAITIPGRGAVIYLRQEGRGIGLLSKIRAYNLQDLGHDTVTANLLLGHKADERAYDIAAAILRDLDLGLGDGQGEGVRLLTNNPDKVQALEAEGVRIVERVPMVPRIWRLRIASEKAEGVTQNISEEDRPAGATLIGGGAVHGHDLDKYLRTKVLRMGHMLPLMSEQAER